MQIHDVIIESYYRNMHGKLLYHTYSYILGYFIRSGNNIKLISNADDLNVTRNMNDDRVRYYIKNIASKKWIYETLNNLDADNKKKLEIEQKEILQYYTKYGKYPELLEFQHVLCHELEKLILSNLDPNLRAIINNRYS